MIPRLRDLAYDLPLVGLPTRVYLHLLNELDPVELRPAKQLVIARRLGISERSVRKAMRTLERCRYIERGPDRPGETHTYRLIYSRMP